MEPIGAREQLVARILSSRHFAHAPTQTAVLRYLVERSANPAMDAPKEHDIAVAVMNRPDSFDPRYDPIVRVTVAATRTRLAMYFLNEGKREQYHLVIPKGLYRPAVVPAALAGDANAPSPYPFSALELFWYPHLASDYRNMLVYSEPIFFRDNKGYYYHDPHINTYLSAERFLKKPPAELKFRPIRISYGCLWTGEIQCLIAMDRMYRQLGSALDFRSARTCSLADAKEASLVLLGNPTSNSLLKALHFEGTFNLSAAHIINLKPQEDEQRFYRGAWCMDGNLERMTQYAIVSRTPGLTPSSAVTIIEANHCRGIEGAGYFLTREECVTTVRDRLLSRDGSAIYPYFQLILRVDMVDATREVVNVECVAFRSHPAYSGASTRFAALRGSAAKIDG